MAAGYQLILTTCPTSELAKQIAHALVEGQLAACVNILPAMQSTYRWQGKIETADEHLLIVKSRLQDYAAIEQHIRQLHTYDLPEIIAIPINTGLPQYLQWLETVGK